MLVLESLSWPSEPLRFVVCLLFESGTNTVVKYEEVKSLGCG